MKLFSKFLSAAEILTHIYYHENIIGHKISVNLKITYCHVFRILNELEKIKLIESIKPGRSRFFRVTDLGREIAINLIKIEKLLK